MLWPTSWVNLLFHKMLNSDKVLKDYQTRQAKFSGTLNFFYNDGMMNQLKTFQYFNR